MIEPPIQMNGRRATYLPHGQALTVFDSDVYLDTYRFRCDRVRRLVAHSGNSWANWTGGICGPTLKLPFFAPYTLPRIPAG